MIQDLIKIVGDSFLSRESKNECIKILNSGDLDKFYPRFTELVLFELKKREKITKEAVSSLEKSFSEIEDDFKKEKEALDEKIKIDLDKIDPFGQYGAVLLARTNQ